MDDGPPVRARVKWFNEDKGFGFVIPADGRPEAFVHASTLSRCGVAAVMEGAEMVCGIAVTPRGPQVVRIDRIAPPEAAEEPALDREAVVKWYQPDKGFGFLAADDGGRDIFVHKSALKRSGLDTLTAGQRVFLAVRATAKGREAWRLVPC
jgi:Cold shock proteins